MLRDRTIISYSTELEKCPECGKNGIIYGHFFNSEKDKYGWLGILCLECGYEKIDKKDTDELIKEFKKIENMESN